MTNFNFINTLSKTLSKKLPTLSSACLLVFHGSRDPQSQTAGSNLVNLLIEQILAKNIVTQKNYLTQDASILKSPLAATLDSLKTPILDTAALELGTLSLHESIVGFSEKVAKNKGKKLKILPLFLSNGVHVTEDIPREIARAKTLINREITIELSPYLGKYSGMVELLNSRFTKLGGEGRILVAHGSSWSTVSQDCQWLAAQLNAQIAYWSVAPSLREQVVAQIAAGKRKIAIVPYFLFPGRITKAIASEVEQLRLIFPGVELMLAQPLGATPELAKLIVEGIIN